MMGNTILHFTPLHEEDINPDAENHPDIMQRPSTQLRLLAERAAREEKEKGKAAKRGRKTPVER